MALKVAVYHEHFVAARVGAGPLSDLLVVLLNVLLDGATHTEVSQQVGAEPGGPPITSFRALHSELPDSGGTEGALAWL